MDDALANEFLSLPEDAGIEDLLAAFQRASPHLQHIQVPPKKKEVALFSSGTTAQQMAEIERRMAARGWAITHRYAEVDSDASQNRPELDRLLADAKAGKFKAVVVWTLDHLSRRGIAETASVVQKLNRADVCR